MGRYVLVAFPFFAVIGEFAARAIAAPRWRWAIAAVTVFVAGLSLWMTTLYARWQYVS